MRSSAWNAAQSLESDLKIMPSTASSLSAEESGNIDQARPVPSGNRKIHQSKRVLSLIPLKPLHNPRNRLNLTYKNK